MIDRMTFDLRLAAHRAQMARIDCGDWWPQGASRERQAGGLGRTARLLVTAALGATLLINSVGATTAAAAENERADSGACADVALVPALCHFGAAHLAPQAPGAPDYGLIRLAAVPERLWCDIRA